MDFYELTRGFRQLWENRPGAVILLVLGLVVFTFLVIDTWRHKRRGKGPR
ncbi:MAG: hypothetical protein QOJ40_900 [Verrucomicrobiota bacterium]